MFSKFFKVENNQILLTNGTDEAIKTIFEAFLEKNDEIIIPSPSFAMFKFYAQLLGANIIEVLYCNDLSFPTKKVLEKINERTKIIVIANPNNPTASSLPENEIIKILERAKNSLVFIDEAYYDFYGITSLQLINKYENLIVSRTFSKAFGLAGLRLGFIFSNKSIISILQKVISPYSVNQTALICGKAAIEDIDYVKDYINEVVDSKKILLDEFKKLNIKTYPSDSNFFIADFWNRSKIVYNELKKRNILVRDVSNYPLLQNCLRIGIGTVEQSGYLIKNLKDILKKAIIFDMDGVLVDVSKSYRESIKKTVEYYTNKKILDNDIETLKNKGGYNNDWDVASELIRLNGKKIDRLRVIEKFQEYYLGNDFNGFILNEKWLLDKEILKKLSERYILGILTGRPKKEADFALRANNAQEFFKVLIAMEDIPRDKSKPDSYGIKKAMEKLNVKNAIYIGDTIDDLRAAKNAGIDFAGIIPPYVEKEKLNSLFKENKADFILDDINKISEVEI